MKTPLKTAIVALLILLCSAGNASAERWVGTWATGMMPANSSGVSLTGFNNQTVRQTIHSSIGGNRVRLRLANTFGSAPVRFDKVALARPAGPGSIDPTTSIPVTFDGARSVLVPRGGRVLSDPIAFPAAPDSDVTVTFFVAGATGATTWHRQSRQLSYISTAGDHVDDPGADAFTTSIESWFFVDGLDVEAAEPTGAVVTLGDSITDGDRSTVGGNRRWANVLAQRILARPASSHEAVVNVGIGAGRVLNDSLLGGPSAISRFDRDVLAQAGVRDLIVLEGVNDIGFSRFGNNAGFAPTTNVSAQEIIAGYKQIIAQAHRAGIRVIGGTILPFRGAFTYPTGATGTEGDDKRLAVNDWILNHSDFDGVVDFDRVIRNPASPMTYLPAYNSGDNLHPNDAGYQAMGDAIRLACLSLGDATRVPDSGRRDCTNPPGGEIVTETTISQSTGATVPATLALSIAGQPTFGAFTPGLDRIYQTTAAANVTSTAADAALSVTDPGATATGRLANGTFALAEPLEVNATSGAFAPLSTIPGSHLTLLTYSGPVSSDAVTIGFRQHIAANQPLRTGTYSKTLTFTLSTTTP